MVGFLQNLKGSKNTRERTGNRTRVVYVEGYPDEETVVGREMTLTEDGLMPIPDAEGKPNLVTFKLNNESHENRPTIASLRCTEGDWGKYAETVIGEIKEYQSSGVRGPHLQGVMFEDVQKVLKDEMTLEGALRKNNRMVEPGGLLQFEGCVEKGDVIEANWVRTLSPSWNNRMVIPPSVAMVAVQPVQVTIDTPKGEKIRLTGDAAVEQLNKMSQKDAIDRARVPVDIIFANLATTTKANVQEAIRSKFEFLSTKLPGAAKNAAVYVRVMAKDEPLMVFKTALGGEVIGVKTVNGEQVDDYAVRTPESAVARHLDNERNMQDGSVMTYRDIYAALAEEDDVTIQVIPAISTSYSRMMKAALLEKSASDFGTKLMQEATGQFVPDLDEDGQVRKINVETMEGTVQKDARRFVSCFTNCISASMSIDEENNFPAILRFKAHLPKSNENFKAFPLMKEEQLPNLPPLQVKKPSSIIDNLANSRDLSAPAMESDLSDMPDLMAPPAKSSSATMGM